MRVIIGMDPHKRSATIEVVDDRGRVLATGRCGIDKAGYADMLAAGRRYADRVWAVEGCNGIGKHIAHRLVHDGETVLDVPAKLSAQVRVFATGNGRKTDPVDAHSVAMVALRSPNLVQVQVDPNLRVMGMLADRRDELGRARTQTINRLHRLLLELLPGGAKKVPVRATGPRVDRDGPLDASSGDQTRHRLSRAGNRRINRTLNIMAVVQLRNRTQGRAYFDAKKAAGKTSMEAMRALKRRLSNVVYARMIEDQKRQQMAGPGGHSGTTLQSSVTDLTPDIGPSDKPLPGPATNHPKPLVSAAP